MRRHVHTHRHPQTFQERCLVSHSSSFRAASYASSIQQEQGKPCPDSLSPLPAPAIPVVVQATLQFAHAITTSLMEKELGMRCSQGSFFQAQRAELGLHSKVLQFIALIKTFI